MRPGRVAAGALVLGACLLASTAVPAAPGGEEIPLWPSGAPGSEGRSGPERIVPSTDGVRRISGIHAPSITAHLPPGEEATGAAVIVLPGGGHRYLSIDNEGHAVARWLAERGVAGFVLKYRLAREEGSAYSVEGHAVPDVRRAIRLVRSRAKEWGLDPARVGVLGFSAGGQLALHAATRFDAGREDADDPVERESSRPAFQGLLYSGSAGADMEVPRDAPPAFLCVALDDQRPAGTAVEVFQRLRDRGIAAELHVYARGGHGFGMRDRPFPISAWPLRFHEWMADQGLLAGRGGSP